MRIRISVPEDQLDPYILDPVAEAVTRLDESMIRSGQAPTSHELIAMGAKWRPEPPGDEHFDHARTIAERGWGDCDDWAPAHCATLRASGEDPGCRVVILPSGPNTYHATVRRSDGSLDDPSVMAGMRPTKVIGSDGQMVARVYDPHDGRIYQGQLLPTVAPMSPHKGPTMAVRGACLGSGPYFEGRVDVPIAGSPLVRVRGRRAHHYHGHGRVRGVAPYAIACIGHGYSASEALDSAIVGAILMGDAAELDTSLDRYKLLAMQMGLRGMSPGQVRAALQEQIAHDMAQKAQSTGTHPVDHTTALMTELHAVHGRIVPMTVGDLFGDIANIASGVVSAVAPAVNSVAKAVSAVPWGDILHDAQAAVSLVPGLGTAVSDVVAAAETAYDSASALLHGDPIGAALDAAYNFALASIPGADALRPVLDPVKATLTDLASKHEPIETAMLDGLLAAVPDSPSFGGVTPRALASTLAKVVVDKIGAKNTGSAKAPKGGAATHPAKMAPAKAPRAPTARMRRPPPPPTRTPLALAPPRGSLHAGADTTLPPAASALHGESVAGNVVCGRWYILDAARGVWRWKAV